MSDDYIVDDLNDDGKKKKIKSGKKGKRGELLIVKALNDHFGKVLSENNWGQFSRSVGSGNRWGQNVQLSPTAKQIYSGDITCPDNFRFVIESKNGYNEIDLFPVVAGTKCPGLDKFLEQVSDDAKRSGRMPLLLWHKDRQPTVAFMNILEAPEYVAAGWRLRYGEWVALPLEELLKGTSDSFWFDCPV